MIDFICPVILSSSRQGFIMIIILNQQCNITFSYNLLLTLYLKTPLIA